MAQPPEEPVMGQPPADAADLEQRIRAYRELYDKQELEQKDRRKKMLEHYEERQQARARRFEAMLKQREERMAEIIREQEKLRDRYAGERDYLNEHHQEFLQMALERKEERIKRHEELRRKAEERRAELARYRSEMEGMSPEELNAYLDERITEMSRDQDQRRHRRAYPHSPRMGRHWQHRPPPRYRSPYAGR